MMMITPTPMSFLRAPVVHRRHCSPRFRNGPFDNFFNSPMPLASMLTDIMDVDTRDAKRVVEPSWRMMGGDEETMMEVELPGVKKEDVTVEVNDRMLTVSAVRRMERDGWTGKQTVEEEEKEEEGLKDKKTEIVDEMDEEKDEEKVDEKKEEKESAGMRYEKEWRVGRDVNVDGIEVVEIKDGVMVLRLPHVELPKARKLVVC